MQIDPFRELKRLKVLDAKSDSRAIGRVERLWDAIARADFALDVYPLDHLLFILWSYEQRGCLGPGFDLKRLERASTGASKRLLTADK